MQKERRIGFIAPVPIQELLELLGKKTGHNQSSIIKQAIREMAEREGIRLHMESDKANT